MKTVSVLSSQVSELPVTFNALTLREEQVLDLVAEGKCNHDISIVLGITEDTVKRHISNLFDKTGMGTRLELAVNRLTYMHRKELESLRQQCSRH